MSWCDKLASTPSVGLKIDYRSLSSDAILTALAPMLDKLVAGDKVLFNINRQESFTLHFTTEDGFSYYFDQFKIAVEFQHRLKLTPVSGGPPIATLITQAAPFTTLLPAVSERVIEVATLLIGSSPRKIHRVGIISTTQVAHDDVPPGIARFLRYVGRPWRGLLDFYSFQIAAKIDQNSDWSDRCIHQLTKPDNPEQLPTLRFDWQREYARGQAATSDELKTMLSRAGKDSLKYFEDIAEGNRFDENLICEAE